LKSVKKIILSVFPRKYNHFMPILMKENALTFDDVLLVPQYSDIASRKDVDTTSTLWGVQLRSPICSANMDTVTEVEMAKKMWDLGGIGILHRYASHEKVLEWLKEIHESQCIAIPSVGVKPEDFRYALAYTDDGVVAVNIDIAHGDSKHMVEMVTRLSKEGIEVIAGNVATRDGALRLLDAGAKVIKVGIGPGSLCTTRIVTGHGVPQLSAIEEVAKLKGLNNDSVGHNYQFSIIADGGIRNAGDCVKALAFGADMVMVGSLLAGTNETPGERIQLQNENGTYYWAKAYRGMASREARESVVKTDSTYTPEGEATYVRTKGPVSDVVNQLIGGIRSGLSYSGAHNIRELQQNAQYVTISGNGMAESKPHLLTR
jgi:IMP dehydrogenase